MRTIKPTPPERQADILAQHAKLRGLGDVVKRVTDTLHIPQCGGCKKRQEALNRLVPFASVDEKHQVGADDGKL